MIERFLFASRWLLVPFYMALVVALLGLMVTSILELLHFLPLVLSGEESDIILGVLTLVDLAFTGSLVVIVIFSSYENFVSKIDVGGHHDWPDWMGKIDFSGLKLKLMSSIVAISAIQVLKAFMDVRQLSDRELGWLVGIHVVFVVTSVLLALTERLSAKD